MQLPISSVASENTAYAPTPSLALWEAQMRQALQDERGQRTASALAGYERALSIAHRLIDAPPPGRAEDCVAALVVSYHNFADLRVASGDADSAARLLCRAHDILVALIVDAERTATLRQAALRQSRESHVALIRHVARHGPHALIARVLQSADAALYATHAAHPATH